MPHRSGYDVRLFVLLHALAKRSARLPAADKAIAKERWNDFKKTNLDTLLRIARALDLKMVIGFEGTSREGKPERQTVVL